jgi:YesN/AraC family two-component response regulator
MTEHLSMMGFRSFGASGAWDALDLVNREPDIAIAIIDLKMPGMDGMGLVRRLRQDPARNIQCIMVSGHGTMDDVQQAMHEQVREFLIKPINSNELFDGVSRLREEIANRRGGFA